MGLNSRKSVYKLSESDNKKLVEELTKYAEEGASEDDLREFKDAFISTKKKSTPSSVVSNTTSQPQKSASEPVTGSSGIVGQTNSFSPALPSQNKVAKKQAKTPTAGNEFPEGSMAWTQARLLENDPSYGDDYKRFKQAEVVPEDKINSIKKEVDQEAASEGIGVNLKRFANKGLDILTTIGSFGNETSAPDSIKFDEPLQKQKEQAKKELMQQNMLARKNKQPEQKVTPEAIIEKAKQIKIKERVDSERDSQIRDFLSDAENETSGPGTMNTRQKLMIFEAGNKSTLQEKDKLLLKKQNVLRPAIETSVATINQIQKEADAYTKNNQPVPQELQEQYNIARAGYESQVADALKTQEEYVNNNEKLGDAIDNLDVFKRDYSWSKNFLGNLAATGLDLSAGVEGAVDYLGQFNDAVKPLGLIARGGSRDSRKKAQDLRDKIMKPIAVEDINSMNDLGRWFSNTVVANQIPVYAIVAAGPSGIAALGATSTGQKFEDMQDEISAGTENYSEGQQMAIPAAFGLTETASAMVDYTLIKNAARTLRSATQPERQLIAKGFWENLKTGAKAIAETGKGATYEGLDETGTQIAQNLIDKYAGDKENVNIFDGVKDAAAAGAVMGAFIPFGANVVSAATKPFSTDDAIQQSAIEVQKFEAQLGNPELSAGTRSVIESQLAKSEKKLETNLRKTVSNIEDLSDEDFQKIIKLEKEQASLKQSAREIENDPSISEDDRKVLTDALKVDFDTNNQTRLDILNRPKNEQKPDETTQQEAQPQTEEQAPVNEVVDVNDTDVANTPESNNSQISNPNDSEALQTSAAEIPNSNQINDEATQGENIAANGDASVGVIELGTMGSGAEQTAEIGSGESTQSTVEPGTSESQPEVTQQDNVNYALSELDKGVTLWNGNPYSTRVNLGIPWSDIRKGEQDLRAGKVNSVPAQRLTEALVAARDAGEYEFIEGSGSKINRFRMPIQEVINTSEVELTPEDLDVISRDQETLAGEYDAFLNTLSDEELNDIFDNYEQTESGTAGENATGGKSETNVSDKEKPAERAEGTFERKRGEKSVINRIYKGETSETVKKVAEDSGLTYEVENQEKAQKLAKTFVDKAGVDNALDAVRTGQIKGGEAAFVYGEILDKIQEASDNADPKQKEKIEEQYLSVLTEATNLFDQQARDSGRFISALNRIYNTSKIKYALSRQIERYKAANNGEISDAVLAKFKEADAKIKELEAKINEAERRAEEAEQKAAMQNIVGAIEREGKKPISNRQKVNKIIKNLEKLKTTRPDAFSAVSVDIIWNSAIDIIITSMKGGANLADAVQKAISYIKRTKWHKDLSEGKKTDAENSLRRYALDAEKEYVPQVTVEDGVIYIPDAVIRNLVESGIKDIDSLAQAILDTISEAHPDITLRGVRDAITKYGKTVNPTRDDLQQEINQMKRLGRLISGLEDVDAGERPLRSGLQREKPSQEERKLQRELREKMRDLPLDHADLEKQWKNALDTVKSRLNNQIEDLEKQIEAGEKRKPERTSLQYDQEALNLKKKRDELRDILDEITGKPELTDEQRVQRAINITEAAIEKLRKQIESGDIGFNPTPRTLSSPELDALKATRKELSEQVNAMRNEAGIIEARKLKQAKDRVNKRIKELQDKIAARDYSKKESKPVTADEELIKLQAEKIRWQEVYDKAAYEVELKNRTVGEKTLEGIVNLAGIYRLLKATGEFSTVLVQGGVLTVNMAVRKPLRFAKTFGNLFVVLGSAKKAEQFENAMKANPNYGIMKASKLALSETDFKLTLREEQFMGNYINNIWDYLGKVLENTSGKITGVTETIPPGPALMDWIKNNILRKDTEVREKVKISEQFKNINPLLALERGSVTYMNALRMDRFNDGVEMLKMEGKNISDHKGDYKKLAAAINTLTGRANVGPLETISPLLNVVFFSFKNAVSTFNQVNPLWYAFMKDYKNGDPWYKPSVAQKVAVYDMMRFVTVNLGMMYLLQAAAGDDDEGKPVVEIETDIRSSDFMKLKIGNIRFDSWHGMLPWVVLWARMINDHTVKNGKEIRLGSGIYVPTRKDLIIRIGENKLSPQAGIAWRYLGTKTSKEDKNGNYDRTTAFGDPYLFSDDFTDITPMYIESLREISKEDPVLTAKFLTAMGLFGINSGVYGDKKASKPSGKKLPAETQRRVDEAKKRAQEALKNR